MLKRKRAVNLRGRLSVRRAKNAVALEIEEAFTLRAKPNLPVVSLRHRDHDRGGCRQSIEPTKRSCCLVRLLTVCNVRSVGEESCGRQTSKSVFSECESSLC